MSTIKSPSREPKGDTFKANRRLNKAYLLKEMFSQLWDYKREGVGP